MTEAAETTDLGIHMITNSPKVQGGRPCIIGTDITVADIASIKTSQRKSAEEMVGDYELPLSQVYAALAYYYDHKAEIGGGIRESRKLAEEMKEKRVRSRHPPLLAR